MAGRPGRASAADSSASPAARTVTSDADNLVGAVMGDERFREHGEAAADFAKDLAAEREALAETLDPEAERAALERAAWLIEREFGAGVTVLAADEAGEFAGDARPGRPAIRID